MIYRIERVNIKCDFYSNVLKSLIIIKYYIFFNYSFLSSRLDQKLFFIKIFLALIRNHPYENNLCNSMFGI
ncbi:hypothetical protein BJI46_13720 [Acinetobacter qingfengensis]|uniref:Uncharacterized protein n=1 Tax=Acinetobacter qingfengensis TaxID=1262585 RepID=A0A1E7R3T7_9GAMM|nr:hypothetical protein BJI46_13720 [Acinetobacter qingfengensis]